MSGASHQTANLPNCHPPDYTKACLSILAPSPVLVCENEDIDNGAILPSPTCSKNFCGRYLKNGNSTAGSSAFLAALAVKNLKAPSVNNFICGGSLINRRYVVSAATCHDEMNSPIVEVRIGGFALLNRFGENFSLGHCFLFLAVKNRKSIQTKT